jgi:predicted permease
MIETSNMITMQIYLLCLMAVGVVTVKARIVDERTRSALSELVLGVFLPCTILASFSEASLSLLPARGMMLTISLGILAVSFALARLLYRKAGPEQKKVLLYGTIISMASFLGNPVAESIYGPQALTYAAAYLIPVRMAVWACGIAIFGGRSKLDLKKVFLHPCLLATYIGAAVMVSGFRLPSMVTRVVSGLGHCTTPVTMLVIGNILGLTNPKNLITRLTAYYTFVRLILIPLLTMGILLALRLDPMVAGVSVILSGMPAGATVTMLAEKYNSDKELAGKISFVSILLSVFTAPVLAWLLAKAL